MEGTRDRILEAALNLFSSKGYASAGTKAIADAASVNEVTLFRIFGSKRELFLEVYRRFSLRPSEESMLRGLRGELAADMGAVGAAFASLFLANSRIVHMSIKAVEAEFEEIDLDLKRQVEDLKGLLLPYFSRMDAAGALRGDPGEIADLFVELLYGLALRKARTGSLDGLAEGIAELAGIFARGISP